MFITNLFYKTSLYNDKTEYEICYILLIDLNWYNNQLRKYNYTHYWKINRTCFRTKFNMF